MAARAAEELTGGVAEDAGTTPSGGINIGPAMTFGYLAGRHVAGADGDGTAR